MSKNKKRKIKIIKGIVIGSLFISIATYLINPVQAQAPYARNNFLPSNEDKKDLTCKDRIFIKSMALCKNGKQCVNDLMGIAHNETIVFDCNANGDFGASHGAYQIHLGYHKDITQEQARNPEFATEWTYKRLLAYGYPEYRSYAIRKHNGSADNPKTLVYLEKVNNY